MFLRAERSRAVAALTFVLAMSSLGLGVVLVAAAPTTRVRTMPVTTAPTTAAASTAAASGKRQPAVTSVVGLGDSVPTGSACGCTSYIALVGDALAERQGIQVLSQNLAAGGQTSQGMLEQLGTNTAQAAVAGSNLTIVTIGANDFDSTMAGDEACSDSAGLSCYQSMLSQLRSNIQAILSKLRTLQSRPDSRIQVTGYWNVFLDGAVARARGNSYVANSNALTLAVNHILASAATANGAQYVDIYAPFKGNGSQDDTALLADDGDHPDAAGHQVIASSLLAALSTS
jgi:lysophospholipase L1-like esterase